MTPFDVLGVPRNCTIEIAKAAYRKLASVYHPDKGGSTVQFQLIQAAWDKIENGYKYVEPAPERARAPNGFTPGFNFDKTAGKPAPGYEAKNKPPSHPRTVKRGSEYYLDIELTLNQAHTGCTVPFVHEHKLHEYVVPPKTQAGCVVAQFPYDERIGASNRYFTVHINVDVLDVDHPACDAEMEVPICALALFTGGKVTVQDHLDEPVLINIIAGHNPNTPIVVPGKGYGSIKRGSLFVQLVPVFKAPKDLNQHELEQLQRLNEMAQ